MVCLYRNIRSESILFFPAKSKTTPRPVEGIPPLLGYDEPYFVGFGRARTDLPQGPKNYYDHQSKRIDDINLDYYQHPVKRQDPQIRYYRSFDIYSLGCVLLEIGLWTTLSDIANPDTAANKFAEKLQICAKNSKGYVMRYIF